MNRIWFFMFIVLFSISLHPAWAAQPEPLEIGKPAIDFELPGVDGKTYSLSDFEDAKILTLIFTCNHCPTAQAYEGRIKKMVKDYKDKGVAFVAISPNDPKAVRLDELGYTDVGDTLEDMKIRAEMYKFNFPYLYGGDHTELMKQYGPAATPHVYIFGPERKLRYRGRIDNNDRGEPTEHGTRNALNDLLEGNEVETKVTKPFGCSIKWPDKRHMAKESLEKWNQETAELKEIGVQGVKDLMKNNSDELYLINVWATWCGPCVIEFPYLIEMHRMYRKRPFEFITISANSLEEKDDVHEFLNKHSASGTNYIFAGESVYDLIEAVDPNWQGSIPYSLLVKPGGEVAFREEGMIEPLEVKTKIVEILGRTYK